VSAPAEPLVRERAAGVPYPLSRRPRGQNITQAVFACQGRVDARTCLGIRFPATDLAAAAGGAAGARRRPIGSGSAGQRGGCDVRLTPRKIEYLAEKLLGSFHDNPKVYLADNPDLVYRAIADAIYENMQEEDEIDDEVETLLQQHRGEIQTLEMDMVALRQKFKREIARKRGFVL
jgi:hypothetical protein